MDAALSRLGREGIAGVAVLLTGLIGWFCVRDYPLRELSDFGPGFVPWVTTIGMAILGAAMVVRALASGTHEDIRPTLGRPLLFVPSGMAIFAFCLDTVGLFVTSALSVFVTTFASPESSLRERVAIALALAALVTIVFGYALGMTMPRWPVFLRP
jgi:Tripartite tricarboxylate transporter TctB family